jgi:N-acetylglucosaminyldiphosphoundecaprenol N-acetyl-beta-D-mannosaminyltransferase
MRDSLQLGNVTCDFLREEDFLALCKKWLASDTFHHVVTLNPEMVMTAQQDATFQSAVEQATIRVPDGAGLIWARWYLRSAFWALVPSLIAFSFRSAERITGVDTVIAMSRLAEAEGKSVYLLGGTRAQVTKTAKLLQKKFPRLTLFASADHTFDMKGPQPILHDIIAKKPAVLFVAYGAPKQTLWIERHKEHLRHTRIAVGVGGAFAMLSEERPRAPRIFRKLNVEWLWRLMLEPRRLPRIKRAVIDFPRLIHKQKAVFPH